MGNPANNCTVSKYTRPEKRGKNVTEATVGKCNYGVNQSISPTDTPASHYTTIHSSGKGTPSKAYAGNVSSKIVRKCQTTDPGSAGVQTKAGVR